MKPEEKKYILEHFNAKSAFHIGAAEGGELDFYSNMNVENLICAEPNPSFFDELKAKCEEYNNINTLITDRAIYNTSGETLDFYLYYDKTKKNRGCSSIRESVLHNKLYPQIEYNGTIQVVTITADEMVENAGENFNNIEFLNIDVQGVEYEVFLGADKLLSTTVNAILVETADVELYARQKPQSEITKLLSTYGFELAEYFKHDTMWGDAYYIKK